jgi:membrane protease YdiL (CAAX protease family)
VASSPKDEIAQPTTTSGGTEVAVNALRCFILAGAVLTAVTVARALDVAGSDVVWTSVTTALLVLVARSCGMTVADLGLRRSDVPGGLRYGAASFALVLLALVTAAAVPWTSAALHDARGDITALRLAHELLVPVVLLTAIPEEFAFRGVLLGAGTEQWGAVRGTVAVSVLFGLWHVEPTLHTMTANPVVSGLSASPWGRLAAVLGAVAVTFVAGLLFAWLRLRSRSLLAPVIAHAATNGLGLAVAWVVVHTSGRR